MSIVRHLEYDDIKKLLYYKMHLYSLSTYAIRFTMKNYSCIKDYIKINISLFNILITKWLQELSKNESSIILILKADV